MWDEGIDTHLWRPALGPLGRLASVADSSHPSKMGEVCNAGTKRRWCDEMLSNDTADPVLLEYTSTLLLAFVLPFCVS